VENVETCAKLLPYVPVASKTSNVIRTCV